LKIHNYFLTGCFLFLLAACTTPIDAQFDNVAPEEDLQRIFARLGAGSGVDGNTKAWVRKWVSPIRIGLVNPQSGDDARLVTEAFDKLVPLTGIPYEFPPATGAQNFTIHFVKHENLQREILKRFGSAAATLKLPKGTICFALPRGRNNIGYADIFVAIDNGEHIRDICILHEMMHALGLIGHHQAFGPSILYYKDVSQQQFSINDRIMLRTLYDPSISAGMSHNKAIKTANSLIVRFRQEILKNGSWEKILEQPLQW
jgi:hypothetical protein